MAFRRVSTSEIYLPTADCDLCVRVGKLPYSIKLTRIRTYIEVRVHESLALCCILHWFQTQKFPALVASHTPCQPHTATTIARGATWLELSGASSLLQDQSQKENAWIRVCTPTQHICMHTHIHPPGKTNISTAARPPIGLMTYEICGTNRASKREKKTHMVPSDPSRTLSHHRDWASICTRLGNSCCSSCCTL